MSFDFVQATEIQTNIQTENLKAIDAKRPQLTGLTRDQLIETVALILEEMIEERGSNYSDVSEIPNRTPFHAQKLPSISIRAYLKRFADNSSCADDAFVLALIYLDKVGELLDGFYLDSFNVHRMILLCLTIACKYNDDYYYKNTFYSKIGGLKPEEFNTLEKTFLLEYIQFRIYVNPEAYNEYCEDLLNFYQDKTQDTEAS